MSECVKHPEKLGIMKVRNYKKEIESMCQPGVKPIQNVLIVVSELYGVAVYVHYGWEKPIVYKSEKLRKKECRYVLHLQCLDDCHYNWVVERKNYERLMNESDVELRKDVYESEIECVNCEVHAESNLIRGSRRDCIHGDRYMTVDLEVSGRKLCGLVDTGAQISLVRVW